jgi:hypothetical protein
LKFLQIWNLYLAPNPSFANLRARFLSCVTDFTFFFAVYLLILFSNHQRKTTQIYQIFYWKIFYYLSINMVCVNIRRSIRRHCEYNFCNGEHQCILIQNKKKLKMPKPSEFMLLALANTTQKRMTVGNISQNKENKINKYTAKKNVKSVTQLKKRALKLANEGFGAR